MKGQNLKVGTEYFIDDLMTVGILMKVEDDINCFDVLVSAPYLVSDDGLVRFYKDNGFEYKEAL